MIQENGGGDLFKNQCNTDQQMKHKQIINNDKSTNSGMILFNFKFYDNSAFKFIYFWKKD